ncbi:MAG: hypothetical protein FJX76_07805 [Armatimonadetes bacterium]|nr:hypothetical protein [Armatimonadota bacterium]
MTERAGDLISRTSVMYREVLGMEPTLVTDFAPAFQALVDGSGEIIVELPWKERRGQEIVERHQIVLRALTEENARVIFYNPAARREFDAGKDFGGTENEGPPRRAEGGGLESMELSALARHFAEGTAMALIPPAEF